MEKSQLEKIRNILKQLLTIPVILSFFALGSWFGSSISEESVLIKSFESMLQDKKQLVLMGSGTVKCFLESKKVEDVNFLAGPSKPALRSFIGVCNDDISKNLTLIAMSATDINPSDFLQESEIKRFLEQDKKVVQMKIGSTNLRVIVHPKDNFKIEDDKYILIDELYNYLIDNDEIELYKTSPNSGTEIAYRKLFDNKYPLFKYAEGWKLFDKKMNPDLLFHSRALNKMILCNDLYSVSDNYISSTKSIGKYNLKQNYSSDSETSDLYLYFIVTRDKKSLNFKPDKVVYDFLCELSKENEDFKYTQENNPGILIKDCLRME